MLVADHFLVDVFFGGNTANIGLIKLSPVNVKLSWVIMIQEGPQTLI